VTLFGFSIPPIYGHKQLRQY